MAEGLTKKQLKELRRLEKLQTRNLEQKNNSVKWIAISVISVLFVVLFLGTILIAKTKNNPTTENGKAQFANTGHERMVKTSQTEATNSADQATKPLTLVEYADIQCPACRSYHPIVKGVLEAYPDRVKLVFKHYPLVSIHPNAMPAAIAAEAAGRQNKFFEFVDLAYETQDEWSGQPNPQPIFERFAKEIGLDVEQFKKDQKDKSIEQAINEQKDEGSVNGVSGTPTFFLEGERISSPANIDEFKKLIDAKLKSSSQSQPTSAPVSPTSVPDSLPLQQ